MPKRLKPASEKGYFPRINRRTGAVEHWIRISWFGKMKGFGPYASKDEALQTIEQKKIHQRALKDRADLGLSIPLEIHRSIITRLPARMDQAPQGPGIYIVQGGPGGPIKLGYATNIAKRLRGLQFMNSHPLTLLGVLPGTEKQEKALHLLFHKSRSHGEWYHPTPDIVQFLLDQGIRPMLTKKGHRHATPAEAV